MKNLIFIAFLLITSFNSLAQMTCSTDSIGIGYCSYYGKVSRVYVNHGNEILIYFDTPITEGKAEKVGINVVHRFAATYSLSANESYANLLYSTAMTALVAKKNVSMQMRGTQNGYMKVDRIWLYQD